MGLAATLAAAIGLASPVWAKDKPKKEECVKLQANPAAFQIHIDRVEMERGWYHIRAYSDDAVYWLRCPLKAKDSTCVAPNVGGTYTAYPERSFLMFVTDDRCLIAAFEVEVAQQRSRSE